MQANALHAVTGAFGDSGKYITRRMLDAGERVITLTNSTDRDTAFGRQVPASPFNASSTTPGNREYSDSSLGLIQYLSRRPIGSSVRPAASRCRMHTWPTSTSS